MAVQRRGPFGLPKQGNGSFTKLDRQVIFKETGVNACIRKRPKWKERKLTLTGGKGVQESDFFAATAMAIGFLKRAQGEVPPTASACRPVPTRALHPMMNPWLMMHQATMQMMMHQATMQMPNDNENDDEEFGLPWDDKEEEEVEEKEKEEDFDLDDEPPPKKSHRIVAVAKKVPTSKFAKKAPTVEIPKVVIDEPPPTVVMHVQTIQLVTIGVVHMGLDHRADFDKEYDAQVRSKFAEFFPGFGLNMLVDCRVFNWPMCERNHIGEIGSFVKAVGNHAGFGTWLKMFKKEFEALDSDPAFKLEDPSEPFTIVLFCKAGINRSVACASHLFSIFSKSYYTMIPTFHASEDIWRARRYCDWCPRCWTGDDIMSGMKRDALNKSFKLWNKI